MEYVPITEKYENEIWKDIPGYERLYQVSNLGRVKSLDRVVVQRNRIEGTFATHIYKGRNLIPHTNTHGRKGVELCRHGIRKRYAIHRLVLEAFIGPCPEGMEGCHNNDIKTDNRLENLRWDTHKNNVKDRVLNDRQPRGERHNNSKLTEIQVINIKKLIEEGIIKQKEIAEMFDVKQCTISAIKCGTLWKHI